MLHMDRRGARPPHAVQSALALGTVTVGTLDLLDAFLCYGHRNVGPLSILQSIASGIFGRAAYSGGLTTAVIGAALHYFIAFVVVGVMFAAAYRWKGVARNPWLVGPVYGVLVYVVMTFVVVPLSLAIVGEVTRSSILNGVAIHIAGVGLPSALFARAATLPVKHGDG